LGETACNRWPELEAKLLSAVDHESQEPPQDQISEMDDETKQNLATIVADCMSTRQRQVFFLFHGVVLKPMGLKEIAEYLELSEQEVNEIYYQAKMRIQTLINSLEDLLEDRPVSARRAMHLWAVH
jgi:DNA-directed RNA polymerase specialized sigma subunit